MTRQVEERVQTNAGVGVTFVEDTIGDIVELARAYSTNEQMIATVGDGTPAEIDTDAIDEMFGPSELRNTGIASIAVLTIDGRLVTSSPPSPKFVGADFSYRDWYRGVRASGKVYVSEALVSARDGHPRVVAIAAPIRSTRAMIVGCLVITYEVAAIEQFVHRCVSRLASASR